MAKGNRGESSGESDFRPTGGRKSRQTTRSRNRTAANNTNANASGANPSGSTRRSTRVQNRAPTRRVNDDDDGDDDEDDDEDEDEDDAPPPRQPSRSRPRANTTRLPVQGGFPAFPTIPRSFNLGNIMRDMSQRSQKSRDESRPSSKRPAADTSSRPVQGSFPPSSSVPKGKNLGSAVKDTAQKSQKDTAQKKKKRKNSFDAMFPPLPPSTRVFHPGGMYTGLLARLLLSDKPVNRNPIPGQAGNQGAGSSSKPGAKDARRRVTNDDMVVDADDADDDDDDDDDDDEDLYSASPPRRGPRRDNPSARNDSRPNAGERPLARESNRAANRAHPYRRPDPKDKEKEKRRVTPGDNGPDPSDDSEDGDDDDEEEEDDDDEEEEDDDEDFDLLPTRVGQSRKRRATVLSGDDDDAVTDGAPPAKKLKRPRPAHMAATPRAQFQSDLNIIAAGLDVNTNADDEQDGMDVDDGDNDNAGPSPSPETVNPQDLLLVRIDDDDDDHNNTDDDDDDNNEDNAAAAAPTQARDDTALMPPPPRPTKAKGNLAKGKGKSAILACKFCSKKSGTKGLARPCDIQRVNKKDYLECTNCTEQRARDPAHRCALQRSSEVPFRKNHTQDVNTYSPPACDHCRKGKSHNGGNSLAPTCDVDTTLGYSCTRCEEERAGHACTVRGTPMEPRFRGQSDIVPWTRRQCEACQVRTDRKGSEPACSWLADRSAWGKPCTHCVRKNLSCVDGGHLVAHPARPTPPRSWVVSRYPHAHGFLVVEGSTPWRKHCARCVADGWPCRVDAAAAEFACERCTQLGIDCVSADGGARWPILHLERVGFGVYKPFHPCRRCRALGRPCDHQRPCDSCVSLGEQHLCDEFSRGSRRNWNCINGRLDPAPGALYYLGLGYSPSGVNVPKSGASIDEWFGPLAPVYALHVDRINVSGHANLTLKMRSCVIPRGMPPHCLAGSPLAGLMPSHIAVHSLLAAMRSSWANPKPPIEHPDYARAVSAARSRLALIKEKIEYKPVEGESGDEDGDSDYDLGMSTEGNGFSSPRYDGFRCGSVWIGGDSGTSGSLGDNGAYFYPPPSPPLNSSALPYYHHSLDEAMSGMIGMSLDDRHSGWRFDNDAPTQRLGPVIRSPSSHFDAAFFPELAQGSPERQARRGLRSPVREVTPVIVAPTPDPRQVVAPNVTGAWPPPRNPPPANPFAPRPAAAVVPPPPPPPQQPAASTPAPADAMDVDDDVLITGSQPLRIDLTEDTPPPETPNPRADNTTPAARSNNTPAPPTAQPVRVAIPIPTGEQALALAALQRTQAHAAIASARQVDIASATTLFGLVQGRPPSTPAPLGNYLARVPEHPAVPTGGPELICTEKPAAKHGFNCGAMVARDCQCVLPHRGPKPVCNACAAEGNARFARAGAWRLADVLRCRAYLCNDCAEAVSSQPAEIDRLRMAGIRDVRGRPYMDPNISGPRRMANGVINFRGNALPVTGCSCATKLLAQRMCISHKVRLVQEMVRRAEQIREWRVREFGRPVCPGCILTKSAAQANLSADADGQLDAVGPRAWACLLCCEWVVNQDVSPKIVDGYRGWFPQPPQDWVSS